METKLQNLVSQVGTDVSGKWIAVDRIDQLAELIVKECARISASTECPYTDDAIRKQFGHTWDMACVESAKQIREHFGINT